MSNTKFTPGPWRIRKSKDIHSCLTLFVETCNGHQIVELIDNEGNDDWFNNANLISAAPETYHSLDFFIAKTTQVFKLMNQYLDPSNDMHTGRVVSELLGIMDNTEIVLEYRKAKAALAKANPI